MYMNDNPFASLGAFGGGQPYPGSPTQMAGPTGFAGELSFDPNAQGGPLVKKKKNGINPAFMLGLLPGLLAGGGGLGSLGPLFGLAGILGPKLFK